MSNSPVLPPDHLVDQINSPYFFLSVGKQTRVETAVFLGWVDQSADDPFNGGFFIKQAPIVGSLPGIDYVRFYGGVDVPASVDDEVWALGVWKVAEVLPNMRARLEPTWDYSRKELEELLLTVGFPGSADAVYTEQQAHPRS